MPAGYNNLLSTKTVALINTISIVKNNGLVRYLTALPGMEGLKVYPFRGDPEGADFILSVIAVGF